MQALRKLFWAVIVEGKYGLGEKTVFDFKYVPDFHITTEAGGDEKGQAGVREDGVERRNLQALLVGIACGGAGVFCGILVASSILKRLPSFWS